MAATEWQQWVGFVIALVIVLVGVFLISWLGSVIVRAIARRREWAGMLIDRARWPVRAVLLVTGLWIAIETTLPDTELRAELDHLMLILLIASGTWLVCELLLVFTDVSASRHRTDVADNQAARRVQTQLQIVRRLIVVGGVVVGIGAILLTFDSVRAVGASVLASAGILSVIFGLAAQSTLANLFAGVQIAFNEAIRVDDVVVVHGEWGRIREITLSYVVVVTWDERTVVLPCTFFTTESFENWTKYGSALIGSIDLDVDWRISTDAMRNELDRVLAHAELWDHKTSVLQVTDATGGLVRVRVLVSANDSAALWDLRCQVREELVEWVRDIDRLALPQQRVLIGDTVEHDEAPTAAGIGTRGEAERAGLFSGSVEAEERAAEFTAAIPVQEGAVSPDGADRSASDGADRSATDAGERPAR